MSSCCFEALNCGISAGEGGGEKRSLIYFPAVYVSPLFRLARNEDDEEEAARERRRRARQERLMNREMEEPSGQMDGALTANSHR